MAAVTRHGVGRVQAAGSAKEGFGHWKLQRLTAVANVPLVLWFIVSAVSLSGADYEAVRAWLAAPLSTGLMLLLILSLFTHAKMGVQVVIEDYVHTEGTKVAALVALNLAAVALGVLCAVATLKISLGS